MRNSIAVPLAIAAFIASRDAYADVTSWLAVGGGEALERNRPAATRDFAPALTYSVGVGSSSLASFVLGGLLRGKTMFGLGTDVGVAVRAASGGFARGDWGVALDVGALWRSWRGGAYGDWPLQAVITGGSPWGLQLAAGVELFSVAGGTSAQGGFAAVEIDLLRLTLMRQGPSERWWPNPNPAGGHRTTAFAW
ncbi:MAG: hypothetical protein M3O46_12830 [Myxococcota bacterium]|nr:hypothetical protein [Myxococcota bacterium]